MTTACLSFRILAVLPWHNISILAFLSSTGEHNNIPLMVPADVAAAVTDATNHAPVTEWDVEDRPAPSPSQFTPYTTGADNLYVVAALGSGSCGHVWGDGFGGGSGGGCGGGGGGGCGGGGCGGGC